MRKRDIILIYPGGVAKRSYLVKKKHDISFRFLLINCFVVNSNISKPQNGPTRWLLILIQKVDDVNVSMKATVYRKACLVTLLLRYYQSHVALQT